eukprot:Opistho-2@9956
MDYLSSVAGWVWPAKQNDAPVDESVFEVEGVAEDWVLIQDCVSGAAAEATSSLRSTATTPSKSLSRTSSEMAYHREFDGSSQQTMTATMDGPTMSTGGAALALTSSSPPLSPVLAIDVSVQARRMAKAERLARDASSRTRSRRGGATSSRNNQAHTNSAASSVGARHKNNTKFFGGHTHQPRRDAGFNKK